MSVVIVNTDFAWSFPSQIPTSKDEQKIVPTEIGWGDEDRKKEKQKEIKEK